MSRFDIIPVLIGSLAAHGVSLDARLLSLSPTLDTSILNSAGVNAEPVPLSSPTGFNLEVLMPVQSTGQLILSPPPPAQLSVDTSAQGLINAFYVYFFPAHPFVLPWPHLQQMFRKVPLSHLQLAIQYIGAFYVVGAEKGIFEASLRHTIANYTGQRDHFYVQTLTLFAVALHMADKEKESTDVMYDAIKTALELGMHHRNYATTNGGINTIMEECIRRTWWELFVLDGMMAGVNPEYSLQLNQINVSEFPLPNEETEYFQGVSDLF
jgi:transcription factor-like protein